MDETAGALHVHPVLCSISSGEWHTVVGNFPGWEHLQLDLTSQAMEAATYPVVRFPFSPTPPPPITSHTSIIIPRLELGLGLKRPCEPVDCAMPTAQGLHPATTR